MIKRVCGSLLVLPLTVHAQDPTQASFKPSLYVGVGANAGRYYDKRYGEFISEGINYSPSFVVGVMAAPSLAVQLSATTYTYRLRYTSESVNYAQNPNDPVVGYIHGDVQRRYYVLPLLARYTLSDDANSLRVDALAGASIFHTRESSTTTLTDRQNSVTNRYSYSRAATYGNLVLGVGLRYAVMKQLEAATELRANLHYFGYSGSITPNLEVGLRYHFGGRLHKTPSTSTFPVRE